MAVDEGTEREGLKHYLGAQRQKFKDYNWEEVGRYLGCTATQVSEGCWQLVAPPGAFGPSARCFEVADNGGELSIFEVVRTMLPKSSPAGLPYEVQGPRLLEVDLAWRLAHFTNDTATAIDWRHRFEDPD